MTSDRAQLEVILRGDISQFQRAMRSGAREVKGFERAVGTSSTSVSSFASTASAGFFAVSAAVTGTVAALAGVTGAATTAIAAASNLAEQQSKVGVVFGQSAGEILKWAEGSAQAMGIARAEATGAAGTFGNLFTALGLSQQAAAEMSPRLVQLASDLASFNNSSPEEALAALQSGLVGEVEPLRRFGVAINAAAVESKALEMGLASTKAEITEADKVTARYQLILDNTKNAQGDFARTSDGLANQQRILKAEIGTLAEKFGTALLPVAKDVTATFVALVNTHGDEWARDFAKSIDSISNAFKTLSQYEGLIDKLTFAGRPGGLDKTIADKIVGGSRAIFDIEGTLGLGNNRLAGAPGITDTSIEAGDFTRGGTTPNTFGQTLFDAQRGGMGGSGQSVSDILAGNKATIEDVNKAQRDLWVGMVAPDGLISATRNAAGGLSEFDKRMQEAVDITNVRNLELAHKVMEEAELAAAQAVKEHAEAERALAEQQRAAIGILQGHTFSAEVARNLGLKPIGDFDTITGPNGNPIPRVDVVVP